MKNNKLFGFTLSECLIALSIVGIIAALTVPGVIANYQRQSHVTSLKKAYTDLQQNLTILQTENYRKKGLSSSILNRGNIGDGNSGKTVDETAGEFFRTYYKITKSCNSTAQPCFAASYGSINSNSETNFTCNKGYSVLFANGTAICLIPIRVENEVVCPNDPNIACKVKGKFYDNAVVYLDINGPKPPNIGGRDMFTFNIYEDFSIDEVSPEDIKNGEAETKRNTLFTNNCLTSSTGEGCFGKILNDNWNMNY